MYAWEERPVIFHDRVDAGRQLAAKLAAYRGRDVVVYALPRGGVVLGVEVARALHAPLDLLIPRKIGHPQQPEYAICALSGSGELVCNEMERAVVNPTWLAEEVARQRAEAARRHARYLAGRTPVPVEGKTAVIVDDGIATGLTMRAAVSELRTRRPKEIVVAVPVVPRETADLLTREGAKVVAVDITDYFLGAVGAYYEDFPQVTDEEVIALLREASS